MHANRIQESVTSPHRSQYGTYNNARSARIIQELLASGYNEEEIAEAMRSSGKSKKSTDFYISRLKEQPHVKKQLERIRNGQPPKGRAKMQGVITTRKAGPAASGSKRRMPRVYKFLQI